MEIMAYIGIGVAVFLATVYWAARLAARGWHLEKRKSARLMFKELERGE